MSIWQRAVFKMKFAFASAGVCDRAITIIRVAFSSELRRAALIDAFHQRWERSVLEELDDGSRELERITGKRDIAQIRRESLRPKLEDIRNNKQILLYPRR